jgi:hypothetical protein
MYIMVKLHFRKEKPFYIFLLQFFEEQTMVVVEIVTIIVPASPYIYF